MTFDKGNIDNIFSSGEIRRDTIISWILKHVETQMKHAAGSVIYYREN